MGVFGKSRGQECEALMNGTTVLSRRDTIICSISLPSAMWGHSKSMTICKPRRGPSPDTGSASTLTLDGPTCRTSRNTCLLLKPSSLGYFVLAARAKTHLPSAWYCAGCQAGPRCSSAHRQGWADHLQRGSILIGQSWLHTGCYR